MWTKCLLFPLIQKPNERALTLSKYHTSYGLPIEVDRVDLADPKRKYVVLLGFTFWREGWIAP